MLIIFIAVLAIIFNIVLVVLARRDRRRQKMYLKALDEGNDTLDKLFKEEKKPENMRKIHAIFSNNPVNGKCCTFICQVDEPLDDLRERVADLNRRMIDTEIRFYIGIGETEEIDHSTVKEWDIPDLEVRVLSVPFSWPWFTPVKRQPKGE